MNTFHKKVQEILDGADGASLLVRDRSFVRKTKLTNSFAFVLVMGFIPVFMGFLSMSITHAMFASLSINLGAGVLGCVMPVVALFSMSARLNKQARKNHVLCAGNISVMEIEPALPCEKLEVLQQAQKLNLPNEQMQQLISISDRQDVPQGWWDVLSETLSEECAYRDRVNIDEKIEYIKNDFYAEQDAIDICQPLQKIKTKTKIKI